jgi:hypothetical protein
MSRYINYTNAAIAYGMARSAFVLHGTTLDVYNHKRKMREERPLMFTERLGGIAAGTLITASCLPLVIARDIYTLELHLRERYHQEIAPQKPKPSVLLHITNSLLN